MQQTFAQKLAQRIQFVKTTLSSKLLVSFAIASAFFFGLILFSLSHVSVIGTNMGALSASVHILSIVILSILFGINLALLRARILSSVRDHTKSIGFTSIASAIGILFAGCASCGLTLASYVGLGSVAAFLPWNGIEVNIFATLLLLYSIWNLSKPVVCKIPKAKSL